MKNIIYLFFVFYISLFFMACTHGKLIDTAGNLVPKTVIEDPTLSAITINGAKLHSQAFGNKDSTLIICLHGGPGANFRYMLNCKTLADKGYRVVFYDQIGSGLSQRFPKTLYKNRGTVVIEKTFYDELKGVINYYKTKPTQKVVLLGHSWGAILATGYAANYPNEIKGLILAEPGGLKWDDIITYVKNTRSLDVWSEALNDVAYLDQFIAGDEEQHALLDYKLALQAASDNLVGDVKSSLGANGNYYKAERSGAVISAAMFEIGEDIKPNFSDKINQFQPKVLFFHSSNNKAYPDSWATKIAAAYSKKELIKVNGVGHSGMFNQINVWTRTTEPQILYYLKNL